MDYITKQASAKIEEAYSDYQQGMQKDAAFLLRALPFAARAGKWLWNGAKQLFGSKGFKTGLAGGVGLEAGSKLLEGAESQGESENPYNHYKPKIWGPLWQPEDTKTSPWVKEWVDRISRPVRLPQYPGLGGAPQQGHSQEPQQHPGHTQNPGVGTSNGGLPPVMQPPQNNPYVGVGTQTEEGRRPFYQDPGMLWHKFRERPFTRVGDEARTGGFFPYDSWHAWSQIRGISPQR